MGSKGLLIRTVNKGGKTILTKSTPKTWSSGVVFALHCKHTKYKNNLFLKLERPKNLLETCCDPHLGLDLYQCKSTKIQSIW